MQARIDALGRAPARPGPGGRLRRLRRLRLDLARAAGRDRRDRAHPGRRSPRGPRSRTRWGWSASTAAPGSAAAPSSPRSARSAPATGCAASTGRSRCAPAPCTSRRPTPTRTPRCASCSTRSATSASATREPGAARASTSRSRRPAPSRRTTSTTGDRVGLSVLGGAGIVEVPAVGGHHQLARVLLGLGRAEPSRGTVGEERALRAQLRRSIPPGAFVVLLSALVSAEPLAHAVRLARSGHAVVVVDTLPAELRAPEATDDALRSVTGRRRRPAGPAGVAAAAARPRARGAPLRDGRGAGRRLAWARLARHRAAPGGPPLPRPTGGEPMIRNRTWRRTMVGTVVGADVVILLVAAAALPGFVPFAARGPARWARCGRSPGPAGGVPSPCSCSRCSPPASPAARPSRSCTGRWPPPPGRRWSSPTSRSPCSGPGRCAPTSRARRRCAGRVRRPRWSGRRSVRPCSGRWPPATPLGWAPWVGAIALALIAGTVWQVRANTRKP